MHLIMKSYLDAFITDKVLKFQTILGSRVTRNLFFQQSNYAQNIYYLLLYKKGSKIEKKFTSFQNKKFSIYLFTKTKNVVFCRSEILLANYKDISVSICLVQEREVFK
jgi:hypothetical protein